MTVVGDIDLASKSVVSVNGIRITSTTSGAPTDDGNFAPAHGLGIDNAGNLYAYVTGGTWSLIGSTSTGGITGFAAPGFTLGTANAAGAATTVVRSDATILAFDATAPTTQAFSDAAAVGTATVASRRDHKHGWPALGATAANIGASAGGSATTPSKSDHVHATGAGTPSSQAFGDAAATGTGPAAAMTDHKHGMMANPIQGTAPTYGWASVDLLGGVGTGAWPSANRAFFVPVNVSFTATITKIKVEVITASGNIDAGLYGPTGTKLASSGSTTMAGTSAIQTLTITGQPLTPGQYFVGIAVDNATAVLLHDSFTIAGAVRATQADTSFPLPANFTPAGGATYMPWVAVTTA